MSCQTIADVLARQQQRRNDHGSELDRERDRQFINRDVTRQLLDWGTERALKETLVIAQREFNNGISARSCIHRAVRRVRSGDIQ